jgi:NAD(P)-dependent dehydrogenase (short-subunit alcohol dehydrogenase family)
MNLNGKVALVTGGGTGIGAAIAKRFVEDGSKVVFTGRRRERLETTAHSFPAKSAAICVGDVTRSEDIKKMMEATLSFGGKLEILVNNAAMDDSGSITDTSLDQWGQVIEVNLTGPLATMKGAIPQMIDIDDSSFMTGAVLVVTAVLQWSMFRAPPSVDAETAV